MQASLTNKLIFTIYLDFCAFLYMNLFIKSLPHKQDVTQVNFKQSKVGYNLVFFLLN